METPVDELKDIHLPMPQWFEAAIATPREQGSIDVSGTPVNYLRWGDPAKPGVILIHGFLAHARVFAFIAPFLTDDFHLVAYDLSGMGDSGPRESYTDDIRAEEVMALARHTGMLTGGRKPYIVAHSYGGTVAMSAAERFPDDLAGILICDLMMMRPEAIRARMEQPQNSRMSGRSGPNAVYPTLELAMARYRLQPPQACENLFLVQYMARHSLKPVDSGWTWKFHPSIFSHDNRSVDWWVENPNRYARLAGRKGIIYGQESVLFTPDSAAYIRELSDKPDPIIAIPHAQHHLMLDQPIAFVSTIKAMLSSWEG